jgi:hypothetical protein
MGVVYDGSKMTLGRALQKVLTLGVTGSRGRKYLTPNDRQVRLIHTMDYASDDIPLKELE